MILCRNLIEIYSFFLIIILLLSTLPETRPELVIWGLLNYLFPIAQAVSAVRKLCSIIALLLNGITWVSLRVLVWGIMPDEFGFWKLFIITHILAFQ